MPYIPPRPSSASGPSARLIPRSTYGASGPPLSPPRHKAKGTATSGPCDGESAGQNEPASRSESVLAMAMATAKGTDSLHSVPAPSALPLPSLAATRTQSSHPDAMSAANPGSFEIGYMASASSSSTSNATPPSTARASAPAQEHQCLAPTAGASSPRDDDSADHSHLQTEDHLTPRPRSESHSHSLPQSQSSDFSRSLGGPHPASAPEAQLLGPNVPGSSSSSVTPSHAHPGTVPTYPDPATALSERLATTALDATSALHTPPLPIPSPVRGALYRRRSPSGRDRSASASAEAVDLTGSAAAAGGRHQEQAQEEQEQEPEQEHRPQSVPSLSSTSPSSFASLASLSDLDDGDEVAGAKDGDAGVGTLSSATSVSEGLGRPDLDAGAGVGDEALLRYKYWLYNYTNGLYLAARLSANKAEEKRMRQGEYTTFSGKQSGMERMAAKKALARRLNV